MPSHETNTLLKVLEQNQTIATELPETLLELAADGAVPREDVLDAIATTFRQLVEQGGDPQRITEPFPELLQMFPELSGYTIEPLTRMAHHEDPDFRRGAIRCLGFIGALEPIDRRLATDQGAAAMPDEKNWVKTTALWSLAKIGLAAPGAVSPHQDQLVEALASRPESFRIGQTVISARMRRYATEALAAIALGEIDIEDHRPPADLVENRASVAAWAIQRAVRDYNLAVNRDRQIEQTTSIDEDHNIATLVAPVLARDTREEAGTTKAAGAALALGLLVPWQPDMQEYMSVVNDAIDRSCQVNKRVADAITTVLDQGPFTPTHVSAGDLSVDTKIGLIVEPLDSDSATSYCSIGVPYEVADQLFVEDTVGEGTVEITGESSAVGAVRIKHQDERTVRISEYLKQTLGVKFGETVTISPIQTVPARKVTLAVPENVPLDPATLKTPIVRWALSKERFTAGGILPLSVIADEEEFINEVSKTGSYWTGRPIVRRNSSYLPIQVLSSTPETANKITQNTELVVTRSEDREPQNRGNNTEWAEVEQLRPTAETLSEVGFKIDMPVLPEDADIKEILDNQFD